MQAIKIGDDEYPIARIMVSEVEAIESVTGLKFQEALESGSAVSLRALVWVARKRQDPELKFRDVDFALEDLTIVGGDDEGPTREADPGGA